MNRWKSTLLIALLAGAAFLVGYLWQFVRAERLEDRVEVLERDLAFQRLATVLGAAAIEAQQGSFEPARRTASEFFTGLQAESDRVPEELAGEMGSILARRDAVITALSRAEPASSDTLASLFVRYRLAWEATHPEPAEEDRTTPTPAAQDADSR